MQQENKVLGILAIVFGAIALLGSWIPIINYLSFFIGTIALILAIIGLIVNQKKPKTLAIIGSVISFFSLIIALVTQSFYSRMFNEMGKRFDTLSSSYRSYIDSSEREEEKEKEESTKFTWTKAEFDALKEGDILKKGAGGTKYDDVIRDHGKPTDETTSTVSGSELKTITYLPGESKYQAVILTFSKNEDGSFLLTSKIGTGLE
ncbi:CD20-like domain-containing protein [Streptococcus cristatus]|uniref:CD20-like domain-containing protein n=1 Tax=Streptococcus cristatus TaxID=45634 RepID=UPI001CBAFA4F|nr:CD20-like domain-containing protein [Streptococcus cristatus]MBZ2151840.1 CD20-like domain-containing protein [Streptococcus cristatus]